MGVCLPDCSPTEVCGLLQVDLWKNANDWKHPMEHYTLRSREPFTEDRGKSMIDPDHMGGFNVRPFMFISQNSAVLSHLNMPVCRLFVRQRQPCMPGMKPLFPHI